MAKTTKTTAQANTSSDMDKLRGDIHALQKHLSELKTDVAAAGKVKMDDLTTAGKLKAAELKIRAKDNVSYIQDYGRDQYKHMEENIKTNPGKSVAIAFTAGVLTSLLFGGRK